MSTYRDILYRDYSSAFGEQKTYDASTQHAQYEASYDGLPSKLDAAIADLGCGNGEWLGWLHAKGYSNLTGVDLSPSDLGFARQQRPSGTWIEQNVIDFLEAHPASFDLLHAKDIVEHFTKDEFLRFLTAAKQALKPGGELWLLTFNAQSPSWPPPRDMAISPTNSASRPAAWRRACVPAASPASLCRAATTAPRPALERCAACSER